MKTTILIDKSLVRDIKKVKDYPRQTYDEILSKMVYVYTIFQGTQLETTNIQTLQHSKMAEIWDSKEDDFWDEI